MMFVNLLLCPLMAWPQGRRPSKDTSSDPQGIIHGQVRNPNGSPVGEGVLITAESVRSGMAGQATTDSQGKFSISAQDLEFHPTP